PTLPDALPICGDADPLPVEHVDDLLRVERIQDVDRPATAQDREGGRDDSGVEHRQHDQTAVTREDRVGQADLDDVPAHRAVAQHRALRDAGGPARVHLPQRIGRADLDRDAPKYRNGYHEAFLASTATLVPLPHPTPTRRFARRLAAAAASAKVSERPPAKTNSAPGRSRAQ